MPEMSQAEKEIHQRALKNMYLVGPINKLFPPKVEMGDGTATLSLTLQDNYMHTAGSLHGAVYFKLLDDSAFLAASSLVPEVFIFTAKFTTSIKKPVSSGIVKATGTVDKIQGKKMWVSSTMWDDVGDVIAVGEGLFLPSRNRLDAIKEYHP